MEYFFDCYTLYLLFYMGTFLYLLLHRSIQKGTLNLSVRLSCVLVFFGHLVHPGALTKGNGSSSYIIHYYIKIVILIIV